MNKQNYTSLELSKWLAENGCKLKSGYWWHSPKPAHGWDTWRLSDCEDSHCKESIPAYDILNDICCKYVEEFFPYLYLGHSVIILELMQDGEKLMAEKYIKEHCLFNPENK